MTAMTGRCHRHHQGTCAGNLHGDLRNRHRAAWDAMRKDWDARAGHPPTVPPVPPFVVWMSVDSKYNSAISVPPGWYFNCEACKTTARFRHEDDAHTHLTDHVCKPRHEPGAPVGPTHGESWTATEDRILATHGNKDAARLTGRTLFAIAARRKKRRILIQTDTPQPWTKDEDNILRNNTADRAYALLRDDRSRSQVDNRRTELGIKRRGTWEPHEDRIVAAMTPMKAHKLLPHRGIKGIRERRRVLRERREAA